MNLFEQAKERFGKLAEFSQKIVTPLNSVHSMIRNICDLEGHVYFDVVSPDGEVCRVECCGIKGMLINTSAGQEYLPVVDETTPNNFSGGIAPTDPPRSTPTPKHLQP